jgi:hypothetical protein
LGLALALAAVLDDTLMMTTGLAWDVGGERAEHGLGYSGHPPMWVGKQPTERAV